MAAEIFSHLPSNLRRCLRSATTGAPAYAMLRPSRICVCRAGGAAQKTSVALSSFPRCRVKLQGIACSELRGEASLFGDGAL